MATIYGSAVASTGDGIRQSTRSFAHARERITMSKYDGAPASGDLLVIGLFKSNDLLVDIEAFSDGNATGGNYHLGLYEVDVRNRELSLSSIVDIDLFGSSVSPATAVAFEDRTSVFTESGTLDDIMDRGKSLWELANIGDATYTEDPGKDFALVATCVTTVNANTEMGWRVTHVDGD